MDPDDYSDLWINSMELTRYCLKNSEVEIDDDDLMLYIPQKEPKTTIAICEKEMTASMELEFLKERLKPKCRRNQRAKEETTGTAFFMGM